MDENCIQPIEHKVIPIENARIYRMLRLADEERRRLTGMTPEVRLPPQV